jgi:hypothetical protein
VSAPALVGSAAFNWNFQDNAGRRIVTGKPFNQPLEVFTGSGFNSPLGRIKNEYEINL